ncbi:3-oxoadipate enol-lactonase [Roseibium salinum]|uniref:3-oxoadipate enol-lactonase n=1 Tax=Roseibium salinum TaxID=1604349 RepID=A0ABT3R5P9_9HYPH|nr:3-oxoadipate enol-lactonase [Roseibium sp. DSM 29163]MCX2724602.1 3-oxoadipate enol-lactonase [Roseibium sp. DSM 29163]
MKIAKLSCVDLHWRDDGDPDGVPVVFANSLGTDLRLWDKVIDRLPAWGLRLIRFDKRGHGLSSCPASPYSLEDLAGDTEEFLEQIGVTSCLFVGLSIGGMIGQLLAARRPQLVKGLVLSNTGAKMGEAAMWQDRISRIRTGGIESLGDAILERWFSAGFRQSGEAIAWRNMLTRTPAEGYIGCCEAIAGTDLTALTSALRLPVLGIGGSEDLASPPDLVRATTALVPGSRYVEIEAAGHLPCVEQPDRFTGHLKTFFKEDLRVETI